MKNILNKSSVYLTICMCLVSLIVMAVPGFAADDLVIPPTSVEEFNSPEYLDVEADAWNDGNYSGTLYLGGWDNLPAGRYYCTGNALITGAAEALQVAIVDGEGGIKHNINFGVSFVLGSDGVGIVAQSHEVEPVLYRVVEDVEDTQGLYYSAYDILKEAFYGDVELTDAQDITLTLMATLAALVVIALPFVLLFGIISMCGRWR